MQREICERIAQTLASCPIHDHLGYEALAFLKLPGPDYLAVLGTLHKALQPKLYVEIGVREGRSLALAGPDTTCIAIDPQPRVNMAEWPNRKNTTWGITTSDRAFEREDLREKMRGFDLAFIDGDHDAQQAARDFMNLEKLAKPSSIIAIHDTIPMDERTAQSKPNGASFWTGDVWRLMADIVLDRPDLVAFTVACPPTGLSIVGRFNERKGVAVTKAWPVPPWENQVRVLNIIPNTGEAIAKAFNA